MEVYKLNKRKNSIQNQIRLDKMSLKLFYCHETANNPFVKKKTQEFFNKNRPPYHKCAPLKSQTYENNTMKKKNHTKYCIGLIQVKGNENNVSWSLCSSLWIYGILFSIWLVQFKFDYKIIPKPFSEYGLNSLKCLFFFSLRNTSL